MGKSTDKKIAMQLDQGNYNLLQMVLKAIKANLHHDFLLVI